MRSADYVSDAPDRHPCNPVTLVAGYAAQQ
jgi:hypothetical protein